MSATDRLEHLSRPGSRMLPTDALFWYAEEATPELRPVVAGLMILDRMPDRERLRVAIQRWMALIPRLRQRVVETPLRLGLPEWEDDPHFELEYHTREVMLPEPGTERQLFDFVGAVFATPLDHLRPLWEGYLIEGLERGRAACFFKVHHSVMDGIGSLTGFEALTQAHRHEPIRVPRQLALHPPRPNAARAARLGRDLLLSAAAALGATLGLGLRAVLHPGEVSDDVARTFRGIRGMIRDMNAPGIHDPLADPTTGLGRRLNGMTLSLPQLRRLKDALGVTLNDLVLTALSGAVGRYHDHRGVHVAKLHCMVPINLRQDQERHALGNRVGMCNVALPVGERDPLVRLERIRVQTYAAKSDRRGAAYPVLMQALAFTPGFVFRLLAQNVTNRINLICTNVPGPPEVRYLAGAKIEVMYPFAPVAVGTPLSVALLSYGDMYGIGIDTDPAAIPDPELLHRYLEEAIDEIERRVHPRAQAASKPPIRKPQKPRAVRLAG
jgi:diacylglycerol O-acyltransferase / wax synthase